MPNHSLGEVDKCVFFKSANPTFSSRRALRLGWKIQCARLRSLSFRINSTSEASDWGFLVFHHSYTELKKVSLRRAISRIFFPMKKCVLPFPRAEWFSGKFQRQWNCANRPRFPVLRKRVDPSAQRSPMIRCRVAVSGWIPPIGGVLMEEAGPRSDTLLTLTFLIGWVWPFRSISLEIFLCELFETLLTSSRRPFSLH